MQQAPDPPTTSNATAYALVISVLKARHVAQLPGEPKAETAASAAVYVQVTFAGKSLRTPPVSGQEGTPTWNADFRWELTEKQLQILKQSRSSIKVQVSLFWVL